MNRINLFLASLYIGGVASVVFSLGSGIGSTAPLVQSQTLEPQIPLAGRDPVMLIEGKEVTGKPAISLVRRQYKYLFESETNRARFATDPERFEIQLDGSCARMGPQVNSDPDSYTVYKSRIYVFGSQECHNLFVAAPEKYLEPALEVISGSPEAVKKADSLIEKAVEATGGAARLDSMTSYQEKATGVTLTRVFPDRIRREQDSSFGKNIDLLIAGEAFTIFHGQEHRDVRPMRKIQRMDFERTMSLHPIEILRARKRPDFKTVFRGLVRVADSSLEEVALSFARVRARAGIDPVTGRLMTLTYFARNLADGEIGEVTRTFSDFRSVDGLTLPFSWKGTFKGAADSSRSYVINSVLINSKIDEILFATR
jgi:YHS domain-containing protein